MLRKNITTLFVISILTFSGVLGVVASDTNNKIDKEIRETKIAECKKAFSKSGDAEQFELCMNGTKK